MKFQKNIFVLIIIFFQICIFDMFSNGIDLDTKFINEIPIHNFTRRMFDYECNKKYSKILSKNHSEYLAIDLYSIIKPVAKIFYNDKSCYIHINNLENFKEYLLKKLGNSFVIKNIYYDYIPENDIYNGLNLLADFIRKNYKLGNVIVNIPRVAKKYITFERELKSFNNEYLIEIKKEQELLLKYSNYLHNLLPGSLIYYPTEETISIYKPTDDLTKNKFPSPYHHIIKYEAIKTKQILSLLLKMKLNYNKNNIISDHCNAILIEETKLQNSIDILDTGLCTTLNYYFIHMFNCKTQIIVCFCPSIYKRLISKFYAKELIPLNISNKDNENYACFLGNDYKWENNCSENIFKIIKLNSNDEFKTVIIDSKDEGIIKINDLEIKGNGMKFAILDAKTYNIVTYFTCDTLNDRNLIIKLNNLYKCE